MEIQYLDWNNSNQILNKAYEAGLFVLIIGPKGTGKTSLVRDFAKNKNLNNIKGKEKVSNMIKVASLTRKGFMTGDISSVMSPRTIIHWAENSEIFKDMGYAFRITFLNKCDDLEKTIIAEYYQRCFGEDLPESTVNIKM